MMQPFWAPFSRRMRVSLRVSMSQIPTTPASRRYADRSPLARKLEASRGRSRMTSPAAKIRFDSTSSAFTPVLPTCG